MKILILFFMAAGAALAYPLRIVNAQAFAVVASFSDGRATVVQSGSAVQVEAQAGAAIEFTKPDGTAVGSLSPTEHEDETVSLLVWRDGAAVDHVSEVGSVYDGRRSPGLLSAFVAGIIVPMGLFAIWMTVTAVRKGIRLGDTGGPA